MKVLVIGGAGYIGSHAVYELLRAGHEPVVIDNLSTGLESFIPENVRFYKKDITIKSDLVEAFTEEQALGTIDVVMHFAAKLVAPESMSKPLEYYHNNVEGVRIMLEVMTEFNVKNVIFSSTAAVYGLVESGEACSEETPVDPINPYGETKYACERMIKWVCEAYDMNYCIFRYFNVAGADESLEIGIIKDDLTLVPIVIQVALGKRDHIDIYGTDYPTKDGTCIRDLIHVTDLAKAHILGANYLLNGGGSTLINLGSGNGYTVKEVIDEVSKIKPVKFNNVARREGDPIISIASNQKAKDVLGWEPTLNLHDIITSDMAFREKNE